MFCVLAAVAFQVRNRAANNGPQFERQNFAITMPLGGIIVSEQLMDRPL